MTGTGHVKKPRGSIVLMAGSPASGKSTKAREIQAGSKASGSLCLILSRDNTRDRLAAGWHGGGDVEALITALHLAEAEIAIAAGATVVIDDCNLRREFMDPWFALAKRLRIPCRVVRVDTDVETCVARDARRPLPEPGGPVSGCQVGEDVIRTLAAGGTTATQDAIAASVTSGARE